MHSHSDTTAHAHDEATTVDPVTGDMLIGQTGELEQFQWFVRAHLESGDGQIPTREQDLAAANGAK